MEFIRGKYILTDDKAAVDLDFIVGALHATYWAETRPRAIIEKSLENSVLLSLFCGDEQVGFLRIVSDFSTFAWICDVYVAPAQRGQGSGIWMMECLQAHPAAQVGQQVLATCDAHGLYEKFGFARREYLFKRAVR